MKASILVGLVHCATSLFAAATTVAINPRPATTEGVGSFVFEVLEVELSGRENIELVDRKRLNDLLTEQSLGASGMTGEQAAKIGKLVGANYYVFGETAEAGKNTAIKCRVVQVETGVFQPVLIIAKTEQDPMEAGADLAVKVGEAIDKLEGREKAAEVNAENTAKLDFPEGTKLPVFSFRIPEVSLTPRAANADPAAEKSLEGFLQENGCKLVQLSRPSQSIQADAALISGNSSLGQHLEGEEHKALIAEAKENQVDILILGIAASQQASRIGDFNAARARVELAAVRVSDNKILATTSGYGVGTDISVFVAEKKAIESATEKIRHDFATRAITAFNAGK